MKIHASLAALLAVAAIAPGATLATESFNPQSTAVSPKTPAVRCEAVTGTQIRRAKVEDCGKSVRAYTRITREEMERGTTAYRLGDTFR